MKHDVVPKEAWLEARRELLDKEKAHSRARDELTEARRALPWVEVTKAYRFEGPEGEESLADLFAGRSQLITYHFMYGPDWDVGCKSCSFITDHLEPSIVHLEHRDVTLVFVSHAPLDKLEAFRKRMDWNIKWVSSHGSDFNRDFHVTFTQEELDAGELFHNFRKQTFPSTEAPGISSFYKDDDGTVYHTYSAYERGLERFIVAYDLLDIVPKGRDEGGKNMAWLRLKDSYEEE